MKAHTHKKKHSLKRERGQGLVEMALILPFLLVLVIGIVEAGVALNRQLTVVNAAREGARFGAFGASADDVHTETLDATSQMFDFTDENAVVAVIHAETNLGGDGFEKWTENKYPEDATVPHVTQQEVLAQLQAEGDAAHLKLVVVDVRYDHQSMLGLPFVGALADQIPIGSWTAMRIPSLHGNPGKGGCCTLPIAVHESTFPDGVKKGDHLGDIFNGTGSGNFGWLQWPQHDSYGSAGWLGAFLGTCAWSNGNPDPEIYPDYPGFQNCRDSDDDELSVGAWVCGNTGLSTSSEVEAALTDLVDRHMRVVVWDEAQGTGSNAEYHVAKFAIIAITCKRAPEDDPDLACNQTSPSVCGGEPFCVPKDRISAQFIRWDDSCD
jgi:hypothetical protein